MVVAFNFLGQFPLKVVAWEARQSLENTREMFSHFLHFLKPNPGYLFPYQMETCKAWMGTVTQCIVCVPADCLPRCSVHTSPCPALLLPGRRQLLARLGSSTQAFFPRMPVPLPLLGMTFKKKYIAELLYWALIPLGFAISLAWLPLEKPIDIIVTQTSEYLSWINNVRLDDLQNVLTELFLRLWGKEKGSNCIIHLVWGLKCFFWHPTSSSW